MEKVLYKGYFEGNPLSMVMVDGILTFKYIDLWGNPDKYEYILDTPEDVEEGEEIDDDYQFLREEMDRHLAWLKEYEFEPDEEDIINALGQILVEWDVDIYSKAGKELDDLLVATWEYLSTHKEEAKAIYDRMDGLFSNMA